MEHGAGRRTRSARRSEQTARTFYAARQTERRLASPKAECFTQNFLGSWLNLRDIDFTQPDTKLYPEFEVYLQRSMMRESRAFFNEMLGHELSVRNVVHSDFAMLNERLAEHYQMFPALMRW